MQLTQLAGNAALKQQLSARLSGGQLSHAYILSGPAGSGKHTLAGILSAAMVCTGTGTKPCGSCPACRKAAAGIHPDIVTVSPEEGKAITVDQVRQLRSDAWIRPNEATRKVYLLEQTQRLKSSAQNAMLKLLEEGPAYAAFLLLTDNSSALLPTVRSRCEELALSPVSVPQAEQWLAEHFGDKPEQQRRQAALDSQGILGRAVELLSADTTEKEELHQLARQVVQLWLDGQEGTLMTLCAPMEKWDRQQFAALLDQMEGPMRACMTRQEDRRRVLALFELVGQLRQAAAQNVSPGPLYGWLCAACGQL